MTSVSYIICATPRSGSTLLCDLLADTGIAGKPASYYRSQSIPRWIERLGVPAPAAADDADFERAYLAAVIKAGTGDADVFGLRLMWESLADLLAHMSTLYPERKTDRDRLGAAFGEIVYVHLERKDKIAQAISRLKAEQSGLWHLAHDGSERERTGPPQPTHYDADRIDAFVREARAHDAAWHAWFGQQNLTPLELSYEDLATDPQATLAKVLDALGLDPSQAGAATTRTRKMADEDSVDWAARFRIERGARR